MRIKYHLPHKPSIIPAGHAPFIETIKRLNKAKVPYIVLGGTLIGLIRDGAPVATDTDYDFTLLDSDPDAIKKLFSDWPLAVETQTDKVQQLVYWPNETTVDFHFYRSILPKVFKCFHQAGSITLALPEIELMEWNGLKIPVPKNPERYLDMKYPGWRVPQHQKKGQYSKKGFTFGCFDPFHYGHLNLIRQARKHCKDLTIIVRTDEHIRKYKGREPFLPEQTRLEYMEVFGKAVLSENQEYDYWIKKLNPDVVFVEEGFNHALPCIVIKIPRTPGISSTQMRK